MARTARTKAEECERLMVAFQEATGVTAATLDEIHDWARQTGSWEISQSDSRKLFIAWYRDGISEVVHEDIRTGLHVRTYLSAPVKLIEGGVETQKHLWADVRTADTTFMVNALRRLHKSCRDDARKAQNQIAAWNARAEAEGNAQLVLSFNFDPEED